MTLLRCLLLCALGKGFKMHYIQHLTITIIILFSQFIVHNSASAQSLPVFNDPIKVREIEVMGSDLDLTAVQMQTFLELYDLYLNDFERVRKGDVQDFEDELTSLAEQFGFMNFDIPPREQLERLIIEGLKSIKAIQRVDSLFFDEVEGILTENQRALLKNLRTSRQISSYNIFLLPMLSQLNSGMGIRLTPIFNQFDIEINPEVQEILSAYDDKYLRECLSSLELMRQMAYSLLDVIDEMGIRGMDQRAMMMQFANPERIEQLKAKADVLIVPMQAKAHDISQLNWRTWKQLDGLLPEDASNILRKQFFSKTYWSTVRGETRVEKYFDRALNLSDLSEDQQISLQELQSSFNSRWKSRSIKHAEMLGRDRQKKTMSMFLGEIDSEFNDELVQFDQERSDLVETTIARIDSILGSDLAPEMKGENKDWNKSSGGSAKGKSTAANKAKGSATTKDGASGKSPDVSNWNGQKIVDANDNFIVELGPEENYEISDQTITITNQNGDAVKTLEVETESVFVYSSIDGGVEKNQVNAVSGRTAAEENSALQMPDAISPAFPKQASEILKLDAAGLIAINALYDDYRDQYNEKYSELREIGITLDESDSDEMEIYKRVKDLNTQAMEFVERLEIRFFEDLTALTGISNEDKNLVMLKRFRERQRLIVDQQGQSGFNRDETKAVDLVDLYLFSRKTQNLRTSVSGETYGTLLRVLNDYHSNIDGPFRNYVDSSDKFKRTQDAMRMLWRTDGDSGASPSGEVADRMRDRWLEDFTNNRDSKRQYLLANQEIISNLLTSINENDYWNVRMVFIREAYPDVFRSADDASQMIAIALTLPSLTPEQMSQLKQYSEQYRFDYWNLCEDMIRLYESNAEAQTQSNAWMNQQDMQREIEKETLRFQRKELYDRAQLMLRMILNDDQIKDIPGLRPSADNAAKWGKGNEGKGNEGK